MIRVNSWSVEIDGKRHVLEPLTVRQKIALIDALADSLARKAIADGKEAGLVALDRVKVASAVRETCRAASWLVGQCFTIEGAHAILRIAGGDAAADAIVSGMEPNDYALVALEAIGIDVEARSAKGNQ